MRGRILVADDAAFMRAWLREILEPEGLEIAGEEEDAEGAVAAFASLWPDLVVLDLTLRSRRGTDALREIRRLDPKARIVMRSARGQETLVMEALHRGALDYVVKPLHPASVLSTLRSALEKGD